MSRNGCPREGERGSLTLELTLVAPVLLVVLGLVIVAARLETTASAVEQASAAAARAASLARTATAAQTAADGAVRRNLADQDVTCVDLRVQVDTAAFRSAVGRPAAVVVRVHCSVPLSDQGVPGLPGRREIEAVGTSPLDTYRGRS